MHPGEIFQYNKDPNNQIYAIRHFDRNNGTVKNYITGPGSAIRPQVSPDGKKLAFIGRVRTKTVLCVHDLATDLQKPVYNELSKDQQETWAIFGVYTNYNWLPDNRHIIIWAIGKIRKIVTENGQSEIIPFEATAHHQVTDVLKFKQNPALDQFTVRVIRNATVSPDEKLLAFSALGYMWLKKLPDGKPRSITPDDYFAFETAFSPDGKTLIYVSWQDEECGAIWKIFTIPIL